MFKPRKTFKNRLVAVAVAGAATLMVAAPAQAYVMASSVLFMENFEIKLAETDNLLDRNDLTNFGFTNNSNMAGDLTGFTGWSFTDATSEGEGGIDFPVQCIGGGCAALALGENEFRTVLDAPPVGNYAAGDQLETGSPIANVGGFDTPATIGLGSYVGLLTGGGDASADGNNTLSSAFTFGLQENTALDFSFNLKALFQVAVGAGETAPSSANASYQFSFRIQDLSTGATILAFSPDLFVDSLGQPVGLTLARNAPLAVGEDNFQLDTPFAFTTGVLTAGNNFQVSFTMSTTADATRQAVPEPATIALLGLGLAGLGMVGMRRRRSM